MIAAAAMVAAVGAGPLAFAKSGKPTPSGNMNLRLQGYEIIGPNQVSILGIGQEIVDTGGSFRGDETFTFVDPASITTGVCEGSIAGAIAFQGGSFGAGGQGQFNITMTFTPSTPASGACDTTVTTLLCNRTLVHKNLANDLNAGQYHCVATSVKVGGAATPVPASMDGHLDIVSGSNGPTG